MNGEQQIYNENTCANIFLKWLGDQQCVEWTFIRAEQKFPELVNRTRWDFVAHRADSNEEWIAIEVKSLVVPEGERQYGDWHNLVNDVNKKLERKLTGKYGLADLPRYAFNQEERKTLVDCLAGVVQEAAQTLAKGEEKDIGPSIAACFSDWPKDTRKQPTGIDPVTLQARYPSHPLRLRKGSGEGNSLRIDLYPVVVYWEATLKKAVQDLIVGRVKANDQLGVAKSKGASKTILVLDEYIDFDSQVVAEVISGLDTFCLSNIDEVHLVSTFGGEHVKQVWPKVG